MQNYKQSITIYTSPLRINFRGIKPCQYILLIVTRRCNEKYKNCRSTTVFSVGVLKFKKYSLNLFKLNDAVSFVDHLQNLIKNVC